MSNEDNKIEVRDARSGDWVWTHKHILFSQYVTDSAFRVYCGLAAYAGNVDQRSWPSVLTLSTKLNMSKTTVVKATMLLESLGLIKKDRTEGLSNRYYLLDCKEIKPDTPVKKEQSQHHRLIDFFHTATQKYRNIKPLFESKDVARLKSVLKLNLFTESQLEKLMLYFLASSRFHKFTPSLSTFFSAGIFNALQNTMQNDPAFWKELDRYSVQMFGESKQEVIPAANIQKMIAELSKKMTIPSTQGLLSV